MHQPVSPDQRNETSRLELNRKLEIGRHERFRITHWARADILILIASANYLELYLALIGQWV